MGYTLNSLVQLKRYILSDHTLKIFKANRYRNDVELGLTSGNKRIPHIAHPLRTPC